VRSHRIIVCRAIVVALFDVADATGTPEVVAHGIFAALRSLDACGVDLMLIEGISEAHEGECVAARGKRVAYGTFFFHALAQAWQ